MSSRWRSSSSPSACASCGSMSASGAENMDAARVIVDGSPADMGDLAVSSPLAPGKWPGRQAFVLQALPLESGICGQFRGTMADSILGVDRQALGGAGRKAATSGAYGAAL